MIAGAAAISWVLWLSGNEWSSNGFVFGGGWRAVEPYESRGTCQSGADQRAKLERLEFTRRITKDGGIANVKTSISPKANGTMLSRSWEIPEQRAAYEKAVEDAKRKSPIKGAWAMNVGLPDGRYSDPVEYECWPADVNLNKLRGGTKE